MALSLEGSVNISGSMTATTILVSSPGGGGMLSSSQQIQNYNLFAVTSSANTFYGNQTIPNIIGTTITTPTGLEYQVRNTNGASGDHIFKSYNTQILKIDGGSNKSSFNGGVDITGSVFVANATGTNVTPQLTVTNTSTNGYGILRLAGNARGGIIDFYNTSSAQASITANDGALQIYTNGDSSGTAKVTISSTGNLNTNAGIYSSFYEGTAGQICASVPYGTTGITYNMASLGIGLYLVTAYMVRGGAAINETYAVTYLYYHFSGGTDVVSTIASNPGPANNNGGITLSGTTITIGWGGGRGPAAVVALRLRDAF